MVITPDTLVHWGSISSRKLYELLVQPYCDICSEPISSNYKKCYRCNQGKNSYKFDKLRVLSKYRKKSNDTVKDIIYIIENEDRNRTLSEVKTESTDLKNFFSWGINNRHPEFKNVDFIIPVPAHLDKVKERGYNQAELLADFISETISKPIYGKFFSKIHETPSQRGLGFDERIENVRGCFEFNKDQIVQLDIPEYEFQNKSILVIDDVITTGATVNELCEKIKENLNPRQIYVYAVARTVTEVMDKKHEKVKHLKGALGFTRDWFDDV